MRKKIYIIEMLRNQLKASEVLAFNEKNRDDCLLYLHRLNAWNIEIEEYEKHLAITATLPNSNKVKIELGHTFYHKATTITHKEVMLEIDPTSEEAKWIYFVL